MHTYIHTYLCRHKYILYLYLYLYLYSTHRKTQSEQ
jgi:hypothetical protein